MSSDQKSLLHFEKTKRRICICVHKWQLLHCKQWILIYAKTVSKSNCDRPFWDKNNLVTSAASSLWLKSKNILQKYYLWMFLFFDYSVLKNNPLYLNPFSRVEKQVKWAQGVGFPTVWIFWWHHIYIALCAKNCKLAGKNP